MISYELDKQLQTAGFPHQCTECCDHCHNSRKDGNDKIGYMCEPTLSELIEACPKALKNDNEIDAEFFLRFSSIMEWQSGYSQYMSYEPSYDHMNETGSTPEEAVANLWLELNKKHD